jgi:hypothetical protein
MEPCDREHYDYRWQLYPHEHPRAYWIRASGEEIVCTRCGGLFRALEVGLGADPAPAALAFTERHLGCKLGHGVGGARPGSGLVNRAGQQQGAPLVDPIFA